MATHSPTDAHPLAGQAVQVEFKGVGHMQLGTGTFPFDVEGWWDGLTGKSWMDSDGNPAALIYAARVGALRLPMDDQVLYGKIHGVGVLVHETELKVS